MIHMNMQVSMCTLFCCFLNFSMDFEAANRRTLPLPSQIFMGMDENQSISHFSSNFRQRMLKIPGFNFFIYHCPAKNSYFQEILHHLPQSASQLFHRKIV